MRDVSSVFSKNELKAVLFILNQTYLRYPAKYESIVNVLRDNGFAVVRDNKSFLLVPIPDEVVE